MNTNLHAFVVRRLLESRGQWAKVAEGSGVPLRTLQKIARREIEDPGVSSIEKLANYFLVQDRAAGEPKRASRATV